MQKVEVRKISNPVATPETHSLMDMEEGEYAIVVDAIKRGDSSFISLGDVVQRYQDSNRVWCERTRSFVTTASDSIRVRRLRDDEEIVIRNEVKS